MLVSIIIRTLNEGKHLDELLRTIRYQELGKLKTEVILVDSGSSDNTLQIAADHNCKIIHIKKSEFSFGRSLNMGCKGASGEVLVMISGHCVPINDRWLQELTSPIVDGVASYSYGRQVGGVNSRYSECHIFSKYFPEISKIPQSGFYCNNANSAIDASAWMKFRFNEDITGLEDMELAKRLSCEGHKIAYVSEANVFHFHEESWAQVKRRFEREALALQLIMPQLQITSYDLVRYIVSSIWLDCKSAIRDKVFWRKFLEIVQYRFFQYWGSFVGNHNHRKLSHEQKEEYFYPKELRTIRDSENRSTLANEG